jgi:hypothetical protein
LLQKASWPRLSEEFLPLLYIDVIYRETSRYFEGKEDGSWRQKKRGVQPKVHRRGDLLVNAPVEIDESGDGNDSSDEHSGQVDVVECIIGVVPKVGQLELKPRRHVHQLSHIAKVVVHFNLHARARIFKIEV